MPTIYPAPSGDPTRFEWVVIDGDHGLAWF